MHMADYSISSSNPTNYRSCIVRLRTRVNNNESDDADAWGQIRSDSFLLQICITMCHHVRNIPTPDYEGPLTTRLVPLTTHITQIQASSSQGIAAFVADAFRGLEPALQDHGMRRIGAFLNGFTSRNSPGTPRIAVAQVCLFNLGVSRVEELMRMMMAQEDHLSGRGAEPYVSELIYLGDRQKNRSGMELVKCVKKGGLLLGDGTCSVCLDEFEDEADVVRTACAHYFHDKCIGVWLMRKASCPMCRSHMQS